MNQSQLPHALGHNVPGALLRTFKMSEQDIPGRGDDVIIAGYKGSVRKISQLRST